MRGPSLHDSHSTEVATWIDSVVVVVIAWRVVRKLVPKLPEDTVAACAWLRLLGCGGLDARLNEPVAALLLEFLWQASDASSPQVRAAAHDALLSFGAETIDELLPTALARYAALHLREPDDDSSDAAVTTASLLEAVLAVEHARRRRTAARPVVVAAVAAPATGGEVATTAAAAAAPTPKAVDLMHSVASLVRRLCHGGANAAGARRALAPSLLVCYVPQPAASQQQLSARASARAAAAAYAAAFEDATSQAAGVAWNHFLLVRTPRVGFSAMRAYLPRALGGLGRSRSTCGGVCVCESGSAYGGGCTADGACAGGVRRAMAASRRRRRRRPRREAHRRPPRHARCRRARRHA